MTMYTGCRCPKCGEVGERVHRKIIKKVECWECKKCGYIGKPYEFNKENQKEKQ